MSRTPRSSCRARETTTVTLEVCRATLFRSLQDSRVFLSRSPLRTAGTRYDSSHKPSPQPFAIRQLSTCLPRHINLSPSPRPPNEPEKRTSALRENIYTLPNLLTVSRILACPLLGWYIVEGNFHAATALLAYAGITDLADGYLARRFHMHSVVGTILDPAADKILMTTLVVTLTMKGMLPVPLTIIILGRDVLLSLWAFYIRYTSLPPPKSFSRYWDFSIPSAEVKPTTISKYNTALQLLLMGATTISPLIPAWNWSVGLQTLQWTVAVTTIWSGASYIFTREGFKIVGRKNS